jgi:hypothetical protein
MATAYKVVRNTEGQLASASIEGPAALVYHPGKWVEAKIGGILVFSDEEEAVRFAERIGANSVKYTMEVWLAEVEDPIKLPKYSLWYWGWDLPILERIQDVWEERWNKVRGFDLVRWPEGTLAFKRCLLSEKIKEVK